MARKPKPEQRPQDIATKALPFIQRIEFVDEEKAEKVAEYNEEKKIIIEEAEGHGIQPKALKLILRERKIQRAKKATLEKFDIDEKAQFEALADAFGDDSPFGEFARTMAASGATVSVHLGTTPPVHPDDAERDEDAAFHAQS